MSPSTLGVSAKITSVIPSLAMRSIKGLMWSNSGPMPSIGEIKPPSTGYRPLNSRVRSKANKSRESATTQIKPLLRSGLLQISQRGSAER